MKPQPKFGETSIVLSRGSVVAEIAAAIVPTCLTASGRIFDIIAKNPAGVSSAGLGVPWKTSLPIENAALTANVGTAGRPQPRRASSWLPSNAHASPTRKKLPLSHAVWTAWATLNTPASM